MEDPLQLLLRLGSAALCGAVLGLNRGVRQKPAGLRTHALVALGAAYAAWMVIRLTGGDAAQVSRIMQGAMTGVGFLGAGVILRNEAEGRVEGLTTAASIWMATILGLGCGAGFYLDSALTLLVAFLVLLVSARLQARMVALLTPRRRHPHRRPGARPDHPPPRGPGGA